MSFSFRAYIDESGDEGFGFRLNPNDKGSSDWFILAAFVTRKRTDIDTVKVIDQVRSEFELHPKKHVHWKKFKHPQKIRYAQIMSELQAKIIGVCVHKPSLLEAEKFRERYRLYFYAVRYLLERLSWLARDHHNFDKWGGDGKVEVTFSNRQGMSYKEMRDYLRRLDTMKKSGHDIRIDFDLVPIYQIGTQAPGKSMGLQFADAAAGALFNGLERDRYDNTEPRYVQTMLPLYYKPRGNLFGNGIKIAPKEKIANLETDPALNWLEKLK